MNDDLARLLVAIQSGNSALAGLLREDCVPGRLGGVGPTAQVPVDQVVAHGVIPNVGRLGWLTIENRSSVPLGLSPLAANDSMARQSTPRGSHTFSVPPLQRGTIPVSPSAGVAWSLHSPGVSGWTAARRMIPYCFHASGGLAFSELYPVSVLGETIAPGAINPSGTVIVQPALAVMPTTPDAVIVAALISLDSMGVGALGDLVTVSGLYDLAVDGATAASPWGAVSPFAGAGQQVGAAAVVQLNGATGVQIGNNNAGAGQTVTPLVTLYYGFPG